MTQETKPKIKLCSPLNNNSSLQLSRIHLNDEYREKWNVHGDDFVCLTKHGKILRDTPYRIGELNFPDLNKDRYFMLLKYVEAYYDKSILEMSGTKDPKHLESKWCILDKDGNELIEFKPFESPYLIKNSCIYKLNNDYFNIRSGKFYCTSYKTIETTNYLFLENLYDKDPLKRGVMRISKPTGIYKIID